MRSNIGTLRLGLGLAILLLGGGAAWAQGNLLAGKTPTQQGGVRRPEVLTDGRASREGDFWKTPATAHLESPDAFVVYDLGAPTSIAAAWLQGDNNDVYLLEVSPDGTSWQVAWEARPEAEAGLRARQTSTLKSSGRFVRIRARDGDGAYSLSEVQLFAQVPPVFPPEIERVKSASSEQRVRDAILLFGLALVLFVVLAHRGAGVAWMSVLTILPVAGGVVALIAFRDALPVENRTVSLARATLGLVAAVAVLRECFPPVRFAAHRTAVIATLAVTGVIGFLSFYNLAQPQFWDNTTGKPTFVHHLDLRQYYPTAKYFREIGYRDVYVADMAAYREEPDANLDAINRLPMRDLGTLRMSTVGDKEEQVQGIRARFSDTRWEAYKRDARYFREVMGTPTWLDTMHDMGGNATPVWMSIAYLMFNNLQPSNAGFLATGAFDLVLLLLMFVMIGRSFGVRSMLVTAAIFGANDFIMYGTNWGGATLRHDWLAYLGLAACALRSGRYALGGALLGFSTMIRAFPGLTFVAVTLPALWRVYDVWRASGRRPTLRAILEQNRPTVRILLGGLGAMAVLFGFSALVLPVQAWGDWLHKVLQLSSDPHPSHLSLRSLIAGWEWDQHQVLRARLPVFIAAILFFVGMTVVAARGKRPEQAMLLGLPLIPVLLYPGNYYIHFVFLLPLLMEERPSAAPPLSPTAAGVWATLLLMCVVQYGTVLVPDLALHFYLESAVLFATLTAILVFLVRERALAAGWFRPATSTESSRT
jgi:hypothetical protein